MIPPALSYWSRRAGLPLLWGDPASQVLGAHLGWAGPAQCTGLPHPPRDQGPMPAPEATSLCPSGAASGPLSSPGPTSQPWVLHVQEGAWLSCSCLEVGWVLPWEPPPWCLNTARPRCTSGAPCNTEGAPRGLPVFREWDPRSP